MNPQDQIREGNTNLYSKGINHKLTMKHDFEEITLVIIVWVAYCAGLHPQWVNVFLQAEGICYECTISLVVKF